MEFNVTCVSDENYIQHLIVMLCSLYENNKEHTIHTHLIHEGLSQASLNKVTEISERYNNTASFYNVDSEKIKNIELTENSPFSIATYYRILLPSMLSESINKVLYLDDDIIVFGDVSSLFDLPLDEYGVAAVQDITPENDRHRRLMGLQVGEKGFCAGVLLINLKYWREHNIQKQLIEYASKNQGKLILEDQDTLNYVLRYKWFKLPSKYNKTPLVLCSFGGQTFQDCYENAYQPVIMHYASYIKPWLNAWFPERKYYWKYARLSGFENLKVTHVSIAVKIRLYKTVARFYINTYVRPFIPDILEIVILDVFRFIQLLLIPFSPSRFRTFRLKSWLRKYGF
jgi:lipopolysaccharide biosynthesis glycosyltransferase